MTLQIVLFRKRQSTLSEPQIFKLSVVWAAMELGFTLYLVNKGLWTVGPHKQLITAGVVWLACTSLLDCLLGFYTIEQLGLVWDKSKNTSWLLYWGLFAASGIMLSGLLFGTARGDFIEAFLFKKSGYFFGAFCQQFLVESYVLVRLEKLVGKRAPWTTGLLFSLAHLPNPALTIITLVGGWVSAYIFRRYRNFYSLAATHGIIGAALPAFWRLNMRVGISYLRHLKGF